MRFPAVAPARTLKSHRSTMDRSTLPSSRQGSDSLPKARTQQSQLPSPPNRGSLQLLARSPLSLSSASSASSSPQSRRPSGSATSASRVVVSRSGRPSSGPISSSRSGPMSSSRVRRGPDATTRGKNNVVVAQTQGAQLGTKQHDSGPYSGTLDDSEGGRTGSASSGPSNSWRTSTEKAMNVADALINTYGAQGRGPPGDSVFADGRSSLNTTNRRHSSSSLPSTTASTAATTADGPGGSHRTSSTVPAVPLSQVPPALRRTMGPSPRYNLKHSQYGLSIGAETSARVAEWSSLSTSLKRPSKTVITGAESDESSTQRSRAAPSSLKPWSRIADHGPGAPPAAVGSFELAETLRAWDGGTRASRERVLRQFVGAHRGSTAGAINKALGGGASLLLTRFSAALRLSYLLGASLTLHLEAIAVFMGPGASGAGFLQEFLSVGGVLTVLEILTLEKADQTDKVAAVKLLEMIAVTGRTVKEHICEADGIGILVSCLKSCDTADGRNSLQALFSTLGTGNPSGAGKIQDALLASLRDLESVTKMRIATQVIGELMEQTEPDSTYIAPILGLYKSTDIHVQREGHFLVEKLVARAQARLRTSSTPDGGGGGSRWASLDVLANEALQALVSLLRPSVKALEDMETVVVVDPIRGSSSEGLPDEGVPQTQNVIPAVFPQQACAAQAIELFLQGGGAPVTAISTTECVSGLLYASINTLYYPAQRSALVTLQSLLRKSPTLASRVRNEVFGGAPPSVSLRDGGDGQRSEDGLSDWMSHRSDESSLSSLDDDGLRLWALFQEQPEALIRAMTPELQMRFEDGLARLAALPKEGTSDEDEEDEEDEEEEEGGQDVGVAAGSVGGGVDSGPPSARGSVAGEGDGDMTSIQVARPDALSHGRSLSRSDTQGTLIMEGELDGVMGSDGRRSARSSQASLAANLESSAGNAGLSRSLGSASSLGGMTVGSNIRNLPAVLAARRLAMRASMARSDGTGPSLGRSGRVTPSTVGGGPQRFPRGPLRRAVAQAARVNDPSAIARGEVETPNLPGVSSGGVVFKQQSALETNPLAEKEQERTLRYATQDYGNGSGDENAAHLAAERVVVEDNSDEPMVLDASQVKLGAAVVSAFGGNLGSGGESLASFTSTLAVNGGASAGEEGRPTVVTARGGVTDAVTRAALNRPQTPHQG